MSSPVITEAAVLAALSQVEEPDLRKDLVSLNMVRDIQIDGLSVGFTVVLTTPACPLKDQIRQACENAIHLLVNREAQVTITFTAEVKQATSPVAGGLPGVRNLIAVASGKGGVGKSTVSANLAVALAQTGARVGLIDADIFGPSAPILFNLRTYRPLIDSSTGRDLMTPAKKHGVAVMSIGFLVSADQAIVMRGPRVSNTLAQMLNDTAWGELDYLIADLPPGTGDIQITLAQQFPLTGAVVITTPQDIALADTRKACGMFRAPSINVPILGVVENMSWFSPSDLPDRKYYLFGRGGGQALADEFQVPLLVQLPLEEDVRSGSDAGLPVALLTDSLTGQAFRQLALRVAQAIAIRTAATVPQ
jgi:ATP-binding protein involved in chromosome partitioning